MPNYFNARQIRRLVENCSWKNGELDNQLITIHVATPRSYRFHARKIGDCRIKIAHILTYNLPPQMMRSYQGGNGMPWFSAKFDKNGLPLGDLHTVEQMLALGVAAGCVTIHRKKIEGVDHSVPFVVIEDKKIKLWELEEKRRLR